MREWSTARPDWAQRIVRRESLLPASLAKPLFPDEAEQALGVLCSLRMVDAAGSPPLGEICLPWMFDLPRQVFGSYDASSGKRLINEFLLLVSKKNGKSYIAAAVMVTALLRNWRKSGEYIILAPTIEAAKNSFDPVRDMVRADDDLLKILHVQDHLRMVTHRTTGATLKVLAAAGETVAGKKAIGVFVDELWEFGKKAGAEDMLREAKGGLASRPEGFVIYASTQADGAPTGVFEQKLRYARSVRDGIVKDNRFLPLLYEFPEAMIEAGEFKDRANWGITNPNLGAGLFEDYLESEYTKAEASGPESLQGFLAKHLNIEIGLRLASDRWAGAAHWEAAEEKGLTLDAILDRCEVVCAGVDGGGLDDLLALCFLGREKGTRKWLLWAHAWVHEEVLELRKSEATRLRGFERDGDLTIVSDMPDAFADLAARIARVEETGLLAQIGFDPMGVGLIIDALATEGIEGPERIVGIPQGYQLQGGIKTAEVKVASGDLCHCGQPLMAWAVANAKIVLKGNAVLVTKQASGTAKIDPLMAAFDAIVLMGRNPDANISVFDLMTGAEPAQTSVEETAGNHIDEAILGNPAHPMWAEMRDRFERKFLVEDEEVF